MIAHGHARSERQTQNQVVVMFRDRADNRSIETVPLRATLRERSHNVAKIAALEARRDKTHALKQGMMQELLTGRIRLV